MRWGRGSPKRRGEERRGLALGVCVGGSSSPAFLSHSILSGARTLTSAAAARSAKPSATREDY